MFCLTDNQQKEKTIRKIYEKQSRNKRLVKKNMINNFIIIIFYLIFILYTIYLLC